MFGYGSFYHRKLQKVYGRKYQNYGRANYHYTVPDIKILFIESYSAIIYLRFALFKIFFQRF